MNTIKVNDRLSYFCCVEKEIHVMDICLKHEHELVLFDKK